MQDSANKFIKENPTVSYLEGAEKTGLSYSVYEKRYRRIHKKGITKIRDEIGNERESMFRQECEEAGINPSKVPYYWYKSQLFSIYVKEGLKNFEDIIKEIESRLKKYSPKFKKIKRKKQKEPHLLIIDIADAHFGKLAVQSETDDKYNLKIAEERCLKGVEELVLKVESFNIDKILFVIGNDILHIDNKNRTTTSGTPQDTDGQWYQAVEAAERLYVTVLEKLVTVADVHVVFNRSNHDEMTGYLLAKIIQSYFRNSSNISFDISMQDRKYFKYGKHMIGTTHGDGAKREKLPILMAQEQPKMWSETTHRFFYIHHIHHYSKAMTEHGKDYIGVTVESLRSPSGTDAWHKKKGYIASKGIECFLHSKETPSTGKFTHYF